jgi:enamine deaminase RidA (YjgF/YER057c/UK114 family)
VTRRAITPPQHEALMRGYGFSGAVEAAGLIVCSGQLGVGAEGALPADPAAQFEAAFQNVELVLREAGVGFDDLVELITFHVGLQQHLATFVAVKARFVREPFPAWTAIGISELAMPGALVEIRAVAAKA